MDVSFQSAIDSLLSKGTIETLKSSADTQIIIIAKEISISKPNLLRSINAGKRTVRNAAQNISVLMSQCVPTRTPQSLQRILRFNSTNLKMEIVSPLQFGHFLFIKLVPYNAYLKRPNFAGHASSTCQETSLLPPPENTRGRTKNQLINTSPPKMV